MIKVKDYWIGLSTVGTGMIFEVYNYLGGLFVRYFLAVSHGSSNLFIAMLEIPLTIVGGTSFSSLYHTPK